MAAVRLLGLVWLNCPVIDDPEECCRQALRPGLAYSGMHFYWVG